MKTFRLIFSRQAPEDVILREFHTLEEHLLKLQAKTNVSRRGGLGVIDIEIPISEEELREEIARIGLGTAVDISLRH